ncbi:hypothetical protein MLD38_014117 [Melastoma candidum]|uniref:Uncharacterized protein n=1 Tax=Melastoma candidum TaxID=119954 RepID=A0ACB9RDM9_9MYRT|nr:hypothetical protein MLD38_014117 [Melastoma candidum]
MVWENYTTVFANCVPGSNRSFNFGIFTNVVSQNAISTEFLKKYFYFLWWRLQNLSTRTFIGETSFAMLMLSLFAQLIRNMQTYLQSLMGRLEERRLKRRDTESGCGTVSFHEISKNEDIERHLCLNLVRRVPFFSQMGDQLLDANCGRLVPSLSTQGTYIVWEGFFNSITLRPGDFCGRGPQVPSTPQQEAAARIPVLLPPLEDMGRKRVMARNLNMRQSFSLAYDEKSTKPYKNRRTRI